jgi:Secretion system C-terminal sorting domain
MTRRVLVFLIIIYSFFNINAYGSHLKGGSITYECVKDSSFIFKLALYTDCASFFPSTFNLKIKPTNGGVTQTVPVTLDFGAQISWNMNNPCLVLPSNCIHEFVYSSNVITLNSAIGGYDVFFQECCWGGGIDNFIQSSTFGYSLFAQIPDPGQYLCNSSPSISNFIPFVTCINENINTNIQVLDPDGDSIVFSLCNSFQDNPSNPPFQNAPYQTPYSGSYPLSSSPAISINPNTGFISGVPNLLGSWNYKICMEEYRNGILIGNYSDEIILEVVTCQILSSLNVDAGNDTAICYGDSIQLNASVLYPNVIVNWTPSNLVSDSTIANPIAFPIKTTEFILSVSDSFGNCSGTDTIIITVDSFNNLSVSPDTTICYNDGINIIATGADTYLWDSSSSLSCLQCYNPYAKPQVNTTYYVTGIKNGGCAKYDSVSITLHNPINLNAGNDTSMCYGDTVQLHVSGANSYLWNQNSFLSCLPCSNPSAFPINSMEFIVTGFDTIGCSEKDTVLLNVHSQIKVFTGPDMNLCFGDTVQLSGIKIGSNVELSWLPDSSLSDYLISNPLAFPKETKSYILVGLDTVTGCEVFDTIKIIVDSFNIFGVSSDTSICPNSFASLNAYGAVSYTWQSNPTLSCFNCANPIASPILSNMYYVEGISNQGCSKTDSVFVSIIDTVNVQTIDDTVMCFGDTIQIGLKSIHQNSTFKWSPGLFLSDSLIMSPKVFPSKTTQFTIEVIDLNSGCSYFDTLLITVDSFLNLQTSSDTTICNGDIAYLNASGGISYSWSPSSSLSCFNCPDPIASPNQTTIYTLFSTNYLGCVKSDSIKVSILSVEILSSAQTICNGDTVSLQSNSTSGNLTYSWLPNSFISNPQIPNPFVYPLSTTTYTLTVYDTVLNCQTTDSITIDVNILPSLILSNDSTICAGDSVILNVSGAIIFNWEYDTTLSCLTCSNPIAKPLANTVYFVEGTDQNGCSNVDSVKISLYQNIASIQPGLDTICKGDTILFNVTGSNSYIWTPTTSLSCSNCPDPLAYPNNNTIYSILVSDANGCYYFLNADVTVIQQQQVLILPEDTTICLGDSIQLNVNQGSSNSISWNPITNLSCANCYNPIAFPDTNTRYFVQVTNTMGCIDTGSILILTDTLSVIEGNVSNHVGNSLINTKVYLIKYNAVDSSLKALDSTYTDSLGYYTFQTNESVVYIKVAPDSASYPNDMPTYFDSSLTFQNASSIVTVDCDTFDVSFSSLFGTNPGGPGFIGGFISQGAGKMNGLGDPIVGLTVFLVNQSGIPVDVSKTNSNGYFSFTNLPIDSFYLIVDKPNILNDNPPGLWLTKDEKRKDSLDFRLNSKRLILINSPNGILYNGDKQYIFIYPNPNDGQFTLEIRLPNMIGEECRIEIYSSIGKVIFIDNILILSNRTIQPLFLKTSPSGIYFINLYKDNLLISSDKWIKN